MKTESPGSEKYFDNDRKSFPQFSHKNSESGPLNDHAMKTTNQEIVDLYKMLQYKCKPASTHLSGVQL
jgi:hypothetical protein